ncbi:MAG: peptidylprolyl isomerase [Clostridia bacterium]|nr:peptidylprolyl isomerase [Clostridia bacterium]
MNCRSYRKRLIMTVLCVLVLCGAVSCKDDTADSGASTGTAEAVTLTPEEYEAYSFENVKSAFPDIPYVYAFDHGDGNTADTVTYDEYRYYQLLYKNYFDGGEDAYWTTYPEMKDRVTQMYNTEILRNHTVLAECEKYGLLLTDEEQTALDRSNAEFVAAFGGPDYFREALDPYYMTEYYFQYQSELELLYGKLENYYMENGQILTEDADIRALLDTDAFVRCKHILIKNDSGEDAEENQLLAEQLLERIRAGEDFDTLMNEYTEDPGIQSEPGGYYFFRGEMEETFEEASFALDVGEISDIVVSSYGYHIIWRCEKESAYLDEHLESIKSTYLALRFYQVLDEVSVGWKTVESEHYDTLSDWNYAVSLGNLYTQVQ